MSQTVPAGGGGEKWRAALKSDVRTPLFTLRTISLCVLIHVSLQQLERKGDKVKIANSKKEEKCDRSFKRSKIKQKECEIHQLRSFQVTKEEWWDSRKWWKWIQTRTFQPSPTHSQYCSQNFLSERNLWLRYFSTLKPLATIQYIKFKFLNTD